MKILFTGLKDWKLNEVIKIMFPIDFTSEIACWHEDGVRDIDNSNQS